MPFTPVLVDVEAQVPGDGELLLDCFGRNIHDLAGLAELPAIGTPVWGRCVHRLKTWINNETLPKQPDRRATLMYVCLLVAQEDWDGNYWKRLASRLGLSRIDNGLREPISEAFCWGLRDHHYKVVRPKGAYRLITPILIHAGVPRTAVSNLVRYVHRQVSGGDTWLADGSQVDGDYLRDLVRADPGVPRLQENLQRVMKSRFKGVVEIWTVIARAALADGDEALEREALAGLPPTLNAEAVRRALHQCDPGPSIDGESTSVRRSPPPRVHYDPGGGTVSLILPGDNPATWRVAPEGSLALGPPSPGAGGSVRTLLAPPPARWQVEPMRQGASAVGRQFATHPRGVSWHWFRAATGLLESADVIERAGLDPGRWYVLMRGRPEDPAGAVEHSILWDCLGYPEWTAWEVEIPPCRPDLTEFCWSDGVGRFRVPLARRGQHRPTPLDPPVCEAVTPQHARMPVFGRPPRLAPVGGAAGNLVVEQLTGGRPKRVAAPDLDVDGNLTAPDAGPGLFRLVDRRRPTRSLFDYAVIPGLDVGELDGPGFGPTDLWVAADATAGTLRPGPSGVCGPGGRPVLQECNESAIWKVAVPTVEPRFELTWAWSDDQTPPVVLTWVVPGLRWRVLGLEGHAPCWSQELIVLDRRTLVDSPGATLEIQTPDDAELTLCGTACQPRPCPPGGRLLWPLAGLSSRITLARDGAVHDLVLLSDRPVLERFEVVAHGFGPCASWSPPAPEGSVVLAWDPLCPEAPPRTYPASPEGWSAPWSDLPDAPVLAITVASDPDRGNGSGFGFGFGAPSVPAHHTIATRLDDPGRAWIGSVGRPGRGDDPASRIAVEILTDLASPLFRPRIDIEARLAELTDREAARILNLVDRFDESHLLNHHSSELQRRYRDEVARCLQAPRRLPVWVDFCNPPGESDDHNRIGRLLRLGIHPGWLEPAALLRWGDGPLSSLIDCLKSFRDLWLLGTPYRDACRQFAIYGDAGTRWPFALDHRSGQAEAAKRLLIRFKVEGLPDPGILLPLRHGPVRIEATDHIPDTHWHVLDNAPHRDGDPLDRFLGDLGLSDSTRRAKIRSHGGGDCLLSWNAEAGLWKLRRQVGVRQCCEGGRLNVVPLVPERVPSLIDLKPLLRRWMGAVDPSQVPAYPDPAILDAFLTGDRHTGGLHRAILATLSPPERGLWRIAWVDRLAALRGGRAAFDPAGPTPVAAGVHLACLADSLGSGPTRNAITKLITLAEWILWALVPQRGGLGMAARFRRHR